MSSVTFSQAIERINPLPVQQRPDVLKREYVVLLDNFEHENSPHVWFPHLHEFESKLLELPLETVQAIVDPKNWTG